jgi:hypothetical protein
LNDTAIHCSHSQLRPAPPESQPNRFWREDPIPLYKIFNATSHCNVTWNWQDSWTLSGYELWIKVNDAA